MHEKYYLTKTVYIHVSLTSCTFVCTTSIYEMNGLSFVKYFVFYTGPIYKVIHK